MSSERLEVIYIPKKPKQQQKVPDFDILKRELLDKLYFIKGYRDGEIGAKIEYLRRVCDCEAHPGSTNTDTLKRYEYYFLTNVLKLEV